MLDKMLELTEQKATLQDATLQNMQTIYDLCNVVNSEARSANIANIAYRISNMEYGI
jgi:hypothetical protein